jgi:hypothetical protein
MPKLELKADRIKSILIEDLCSVQKFGTVSLADFLFLIDPRW